MESKVNILKVGMDFNKSIEQVDTKRINTLTEATLLRNLYSPLFEYDENGNLVTGLVKNYYWDNGSLILEIMDRSLNSDGSSIDANDVLLSLKRLIIDGENLHGDLKEIICPNFSLKSVNDECPGMQVNEGKLIFTPINSSVGQHLIQLLASVDYRIIPRRAIDWTESKNKIVNYQLTSGPYYIESYDNVGHLKLKANIYHYMYSKDMPQVIECLPALGRSAAELFIKNEIDLIPTTTTISVDDLNLINDSKMPYEIYKTHKIRIKLLFFSKSAMKNFTVSERFAAANVLESEYRKIILPFEEDTVQFFQDFGEGYLSADQIESIIVLRKNTILLNKKSIFQLGIYKSSLPKWEHFFTNNLNFTHKIISRHPVETEIELRPDIYSGINDVAFNASLPLISYNLKQGHFGNYGPDSNQKIIEYMKLENKQDRILFLNHLHFETLKKCAIYPLSASPYIAVLNNKWKLKLNPYFAATELWQIRKN